MGFVIDSRKESRGVGEGEKMISGKEYDRVRKCLESERYDDSD